MTPSAPMWSAMAYRTRQMLSAEPVVVEHVETTQAVVRSGQCAEGMWDQWPHGVEYATQPRMHAVRQAIVEPIVRRIEDGDIRGWDTFAVEVSEEAFGLIDPASLWAVGLLGRLAWFLVFGAVKALFKQVVWWLVCYFVRLAIQDIKHKLLGHYAETMGPSGAFMARWEVEDQG